jgi:hypothetical protein
MLHKLDIATGKATPAGKVDGVQAKCATSRSCRECDCVAARAIWSRGGVSRRGIVVLPNTALQNDSPD